MVRFLKVLIGYAGSIHARWGTWNAYMVQVSFLPGDILQSLMWAPTLVARRDGKKVWEIDAKNST